MYTGKSFREVAIMWREAKRPIVKHSTMCAYNLTLQTHLLPRFGDMTSIGEADVQRFALEKLTSGLAKKTVRDMVAILKSVVRYGNKYAAYPFEEWNVEYPTDTEMRRLPILAMGDQKKLMRYLTENPTRQNIGIMLAVSTGMRIGEVCALRWEDVDMVQRIITVRHTVGRVYNCERKSTEIIYSTPKTRKSCREIPISGQLMRLLKAVRSKSESPYVVGNAANTKEPRAYRDYYTRLLKRLGIPKTVFHVYRHTFATRCIESQCDYKTVSAILGHSNVATTLNLYVHPDIGQKRRCIERMNRFLNMGE